MQSVPCEFVYRGIDTRDRDRLCKLSRDVKAVLQGLKVPAARAPMQQPVMQPMVNPQKETRADKELQAYRLLPAYLKSVNDQIQRLENRVPSVPVVDSTKETTPAAPVPSVPVVDTVMASPSVPPVTVPKEMPKTNLPPPTRKSAVLPSQKVMTEPSVIDGTLIPTSIVELAGLLANLIGVVNMDERRQFELANDDNIARVLRVVRKHPGFQDIKDRIDSTLNRGFTSAQDVYELYVYLYDRIPEAQRGGLPKPDWVRSKFVPQRRVDVQPRSIPQITPPPVSQMVPQPSVPLSPPTNPFAETQPSDMQAEYNPFTETLTAPGAIQEEDPPAKFVREYYAAAELLSVADNSPNVDKYFALNYNKLTNNPVLVAIIGASSFGWDRFNDLLNAPPTEQTEIRARRYLGMIQDRLRDQRPELWDAIKYVLRNYPGEATLQAYAAGLLLSEFGNQIPDSLLSTLNQGILPPSTDMLSAIDGVSYQRVEEAFPQNPVSGEAALASLTPEEKTINLFNELRQRPQEPLTPEQEAINLLKRLRQERYGGWTTRDEYLKLVEEIQDNDFLLEWLSQQELMDTLSGALDESKPPVIRAEDYANKIVDRLYNDWYVPKVL
jgi:Asp-tRNA(Asn)/Glu-tRNA(Gln) amidotransferase C subunit